MQRAFEAMQERRYAAFDGARFERRSDLIVADGSAFETSRSTSY
jgi:hypothetical protein